MKARFCMLHAMAVGMFILGVLMLAGCSSDEGQSISSYLQETSYEGTTEEWLNSLLDEQRAAIDIAYDTDVASGYQGNEIEWLSEKSAVRLDSSGDVVVMLPDGGEFTISDPAKNDQRASAKGTPSGTNKDTEKDSTERSNDHSEEQSVAGNSFSCVSVETVNAHAGDDDVVVRVSLENNPGILGMTSSISYDESAMTLTTVESGSAFKDVLSLTRSRSLGTGCVFTWDGVDLSSEDVKDGPILILHFNISKDASAGVYPIVIRGCDTALDTNLEEIGLSIEDGKVIVG